MYELINDDALIALTKIEENSIDLTVTSPPIELDKDYFEIAKQRIEGDCQLLTKPEEV